MVIDTSALLAIFFEEPNAQWAAEQLKKHATQLKMSTVNLAETLIRIQDRQPHLAETLEDQLNKSGIQFVAPDFLQARIAAKARHRFPINLGDCFAYALAIRENCPILTIDKDFRAVDCPVIMPPQD